MTYKIFPRWLLSGLIVALAIITIFTQVDNSAARPPWQDDPQPDFIVTIQTSPDGSATIESHETRLDSAYFAGHGVMEEVTIAPAGLVLADGREEGVYTSGVIVSPLPITTDIVPLWQADVPEGSELNLETRLSFDGGESWSDWINNPLAFYPVRDNLYAGNLMWVDSEGAAIQFRLTLRAAGPGLSPTLSSLILVFNDASRGPTDGDVAAQMAGVNAAEDANTCPVARPAVVSRTQWGCPDGQLSPRRPPVYAPVTHVIIHQAETPNQTSPYLDWAGWVRSVWHYHANILGWGDVGYNYIIDPDGTIYEGRAGGDDVVGIHDRINRGSMAIGFLGCYGNCDDPRLSVAEPSQEMLDSAVELIAWKLGQKGIDPLSSAPYGSLSDIPVIAGGRDVVPTTSPGDNLYDRLPELRTAVDERLQECVQLQACQIADVVFNKAAYQVNDVISMTVKLVDAGGVPLGGARVTADVQPPSAATQAEPDFELIDRTGDYDGSYSQTANPGEYLFTFNAVDPTGTRFAPCSRQVTVVVGPAEPISPCQIELSLSKAQYQVGETISMTATVTNGPGAVVSATVAGPGKPVFGPFALSGAGPYTGSYTDTTPAGSYLLTATASDPTGQNFLACSVEQTAQVISSTTGTVVRVLPATVSLPLCITSPNTSTISISNVVGLRAVDLEIAYDPDVIEIIDADPGETGVQVAPGPAFQGSSALVAAKDVDPVAGRIEFAATLIGSGNLLNGNANLVIINWRPRAAGTSPLTLEQVTLVGDNSQVIAGSAENGSIEVRPGCQGPIVGVILLQGRQQHGGVVVRNDQGQEVQTGADGSFAISSGGNLNASFPGYLSGLAAVDSSQAAGQAPVDLGQITLPAGDTNGDNVINIFDLAYLAGRYESNDGTADLNGDGTVNILDLALAAGNYEQQGPLSNWH